MGTEGFDCKVVVVVQTDDDVVEATKARVQMGLISGLLNTFGRS